MKNSANAILGSYLACKNYSYLVKEADFKQKVKDWTANLLLGGAAVGSPLAGFGLGGVTGGFWGSIPATMRLEQALSKSPRVSSLDFFMKHAPEMQFVPGVKGYAAHGLAHGMTPEQARQFGEALNAGGSGVSSYSPTIKKIVAPDMADPSILAHELGHYKDKQIPPKGLFDVILGKQLAGEQQAWNRAKQLGFKVDTPVKREALGTYEGGMTGARVGGGVGGGLGLLGSGVAGSALAKRLRRKRNV